MPAARCTRTLLLSSLPVSHPDRLVEISTLDPKGAKGRLSMPAFQLIQSQAGIFTSALAWNGGAVENLEMNGISSWVWSMGLAAIITQRSGFVRRWAGSSLVRILVSKHSLVAVIAYRDWQERYHSDPGVIGKTILIDGEPYTIIGVRPKSFPGLIRENAADATVPLTLKTSGIAAPLSDGSGMASIPRRHGRGWRRSGR